MKFCCRTYILTKVFYFLAVNNSKLRKRILMNNLNELLEENLGLFFENLRDEVVLGLREYLATNSLSFENI